VVYHAPSCHARKCLGNLLLGYSEAEAFELSEPVLKGFMFMQFANCPLVIKSLFDRCCPYAMISREMEFAVQDCTPACP
jgi:hypothetical protein